MGAPTGMCDDGHRAAVPAAAASSIRFSKARYGWAMVTRAFENRIEEAAAAGTAARWPSSHIPVGAPVPRGDL